VAQPHMKTYEAKNTIERSVWESEGCGELRNLIVVESATISTLCKYQEILLKNTCKRDC
jgi:hypothetical protein